VRSRRAPSLQQGIRLVVIIRDRFFSLAIRVQPHDLEVMKYMLIHGPVFYPDQRGNFFRGGYAFFGNPPETVSRAIAIIPSQAIYSDHIVPGKFSAKFLSFIMQVICTSVLPRIHQLSASKFTSPSSPTKFSA
jgi:hypothetical protein